MNFVPNQLGLAVNLYMTSDATQQFVMGQRADVLHDAFGAMELIYARSNSAISRWGLCTLTPTWNGSELRFRHHADPVPNTANLGKSLCVALAQMGSGEFGWFAVSAVAIPINGTANVAADTAFGITAAGQIGAISNGKQVLNARVVQPANTSLTITALDKQAAGSTRLNLPHCTGLFEGMYVSGTGIASGATVVDIAPDEKSVTLSAANTAAPSGTITFAAQNGTIYYNRCQINRPFAQGQIT